MTPADTSNRLPLYYVNGVCVNNQKCKKTFHSSQVEVVAKHFQSSVCVCMHAGRCEGVHALSQCAERHAAACPALVRLRVVQVSCPAASVRGDGTGNENGGETDREGRCDGGKQRREGKREETEGGGVMAVTAFK